MFIVRVRTCTAVHVHVTAVRVQRCTEVLSKVREYFRKYLLPEVFIHVRKYSTEVVVLCTLYEIKYFRKYESTKVQLALLYT